jgi:uncharacterized protein (DUF302 family)
MMPALLRLLALLALLVASAAASADNMIMGRAALRAEIVLEYVKSSIEEHGYSIAHVQLCDGGMKDFGYSSDVYRVVFFGKIDEVRSISERHPELVSYLPLKIAVIAEKDETLLSVLNPEALAPFFSDRELQIQFSRWHSDLKSIFRDVRRSAVEHAASSG